MQFVAFIPLFLVIVFGGGYAQQFIQSNGTDPQAATEQDIVAPSSQELPVRTPIAPPTPQPKAAVSPSVPTSQPVAKPIEKKKKKGGTKKHDDSFYFDSYVPSYTYTPPTIQIPKTVTPPPIDYAAIAAIAAKKQTSCKKAVNQCMAAIGGKIMQFSGSAYTSAARILGDDCNSQYKSCIK